MENVSYSDSFKSVTLEFLEALPSLDVKNNQKHFLAAMFLLGFDVTKKIHEISDVLVRFKHAPSYSRKTTLYAGTLRKDFSLKSIWRNTDVMDLDCRNTQNDKEFNVVVQMLQKEKQLVTDLPFDLPVYEGRDGTLDLKNHYLTKDDKKRYKVINLKEESMDKLLAKEQIFESPFEEE